MINIDVLYNHQKQYYEKLSRQILSFHSLVCIPTGGGKTRLAVTYAINQVLSKGKKILWVTHSQYLLNQAYETFENLINNSAWMEKYSILIHSNACSANSINNTHKLVITSFQSLMKCKINWQSIIGNDVFIIVDEAHHIVAPSYMNLIKDYSIGKNMIGLSATPLRGKKSESNELYSFFETDLGVKVHITSLFKEKILVRPIFEEVNFSLNNSDIYTLDDLCNNLSAEAENYNLLIFNIYKDNEIKYGKTVIFTLNKEHADSIYDMFVNNGYRDKVYKVYSGLSNREEQFEKFSKSVDGILININIMNEGVDIPDIQSVFLTKPLNSRIAVTQIIGRALRNSKNTSKKCAYIVNFAVSNLGRKILLVTPKLSYRLYEAEWNEEEEVLDAIEREEENISAIAELVEEAIKKKATCSFSNVCLAGHFTLIEDENTDIPLPVNFNEYRRIIGYISKMKQGEQISFPKKLFFCEQLEQMHQLIDSAIYNNTEIVFTKYDDDLFLEMDKLLGEIRELYNLVKDKKYTRKELGSKIKDLYSQLSSDIVYYLNQIGANSEVAFKLLVENELVIIKYERKEEK